MHHKDQANGLTRRAFMNMGLRAGLYGGLCGTLLGGSSLLPGLSRAEARPADRFDLAIRARIWPGPGSSVIEDGLVLVQGRSITVVGPWRPEQLPQEMESGAEFHDWRGLTVIPGLLDAHTHRAWSPETRRSEYLEQGLVALGDLAAPLDRLAELGRDRLPDGSPTARAAFAGPMLCPPGGYPLATHGPQWGLAVDSPKSAAQAVEFLAKQGATLVKLGFEPGSAAQWPLLEPAVARAVVHEAHGLGMVVRCHCQDLLGLELALAVGVDVVEHVPGRWTTPQGARPVYAGNLAEARPGARLEELVRVMAGQGTAWCPTLGVGAATGWMLRGMQRAVGLFHRLGGRVVLGTDVPFVVREPGLPLAEMALLAGCGLTPEQVLATAMENAAQACGFTGLGRLASGRDADFLALGADPLTDIQNVARIQGLVLQGRVLVTN